ncbi:type II secretion system F family protein [Actinoplanes sp. TFC3]|uniref:type II secretion system F family protein n=1 Tax=Actinoplanes sp. TFC3 TaxID=1710355 RepID=UPI00082FCABF|nr:type II secretion system F family protein [Actinoplanes sp. TFC3]
MIWLALAVIGLTAAVFLIAYVILDALFGRTSFQRRLASLRRFAVQNPIQNGRWLVLLRTEVTRLGEWLARIIRLDSHALLDAAAVPIRPAEWLVIRAAAALALALVLGLILPWYLGVPAGLAAGLLLPNALLQGRVERRKQRFAEELPDTLQMVVSSLRSGFTLQHGLENAVRDSTGPVPAELRRALSETRLGAELEDALEGVGQRTGNHDMQWLVMAIKLQREVGGSLSEVLQTTADTMRDRQNLRRNVRTLSAEGRLSAGILLAMPLILGTWMLLFRREYIRPLYTDPRGLLMLGIAAVLLVVGGLWLRRVVKVEV